ncbi:AIR carboxylase family protein [Candidatus Woesearchaeota archaeon]|nr:AIR carboxylase family protein [Candidatus Woesearchaeota archaeon]
MVKPQLLLALGSPSDLGWLNDLTLDDRVEFSLSVASAHRTPETVDHHKYWKRWDAIVAGAGMTNALLSEYVKAASPEQLVFGVPISDKATMGRSSVLSSQELPPGYVSACVAMGKVDRAASIAADLVCNVYDRIVIFDSGKELSERAAKMCALLGKFGVDHRVVSWPDKSLPDYNDGELPLVLFNEAVDISFNKDKIESGPVIASSAYLSCETYSFVANRNPGVAFVGFENPTNLALFGAKVVSRNNAQVGRNIVDYLEKGVKKYDEFKEVIPLTPESLDALKAKYGVKK